MVDERGREIDHIRINSLEDSANVIASATGVVPRVDDPAVQTKLAGVRAMRKRETAIEHYRWNEGERSDDVQRMSA